MKRRKNDASVWIKENRICQSGESDHEGRSLSVSASVLVNGFGIAAAAAAVVAAAVDFVAAAAAFEDTS